MEKLLTPFGEIKILIDGEPVEYQAQKGSGIENVCPDLLGRYQIKVNYVPDGMKHVIACIFDPSCLYERITESGERMDCQSFYNDDRYKMSIGIECNDEFLSGLISSGLYDYNSDYLENGMAYLVGEDTKTENYVFGIAWIDDVEWDDQFDDNYRDYETWYGADPTLKI